MSSYKPYGKLIAVFKKNSHGSECGLMDRTLEIYETKRGLRGDLWDSGTIGWKTNHGPFLRAHFYHKDNDATVYRVKEYFGFTGPNVLEVNL